MNKKLNQILRNNIKTSAALLLSFLLVWSWSAIADYKSEIIASCQAYQTGADKGHANACKLYIDGFIDAAIYTYNGAIIDDSQVNITKAKQSNFMERAYQTRLPRRITSEIDNVNIQFCIARGDDRKAIASKIAKAINISELKHKPLKKILFKTLVNVYPCET